MAKSRLDKFLAGSKLATRSEAKELVRKGRVTVNGEICREADRKIDSESDEICLDGEQVRYDIFEYYLLHKPEGYVTATRDNVHPNVMELVNVPRKAQLFPVGRLDVDTEGLLLITNDGALAHRLLSPKNHVDKTYFAETDIPISDEDILAFREGLDIGDEKRTMPAELQIPDPSDKCRTLVTLREGRFHQVKRMFQARGKKVCYLKRISMGSLQLEESLKKGDFRSLTTKEIKELQREGNRV